uniref:Uncharacterized protein n=1 Tax=Tetraselmis sp. GSL018 TaxID=582737 RepID=A0A061R123_9CHLO
MLGPASTSPTVDRTSDSVSAILNVMKSGKAHSARGVDFPAALWFLRSTTSKSEHRSLSPDRERHHMSKRFAVYSFVYSDGKARKVSSTKDLTGLHYGFEHE